MRSLLTAMTIAASVMLGSAAAISAEEPKSLGTFKDWSSYTFSEGSNPVCYMATKPVSSKPDGLTRGDVFAMITHRPSEKSFGVVSIVAGYSYKKDSEVTATIGNQRFAMFTDGDTAWARDEATDKALVNAIKAGDKLVVVGTSSRGTQTTDTFSLSGTSAALKAISDKCGGN